MDNVIAAQELKRRGIRAVDEALKNGPVHVIRRNRPRYMILSEEAWQQLAPGTRARQQLGDRVMADGAGRSAPRSRAELDRGLQAERDGWDD